MEYYDGHIHIINNNPKKERFLERTKNADISGGLIISLSPKHKTTDGCFISFKKRLSDVITFCESNSMNNFYSFFWIDPLAKDASDQVKYAVVSGISGFKVICNSYYPSHTEAMKIYKLIAHYGKPILFHSGILWDGQDSGKYNRPVEFECLLNIKGLRFSLAHISWPWYDECLAVYGKYLNAYTRRSELSTEMFIDITPGTSEIYRKDALVKLFSIGYDIENNIIFGSDCNTRNYNSDWVKNWINIDNSIYDNLNLSKNVQKKIFKTNLLRFLGKINDKMEKRYLRPGE